MGNRDRDHEGRPRNSRPRDELGRPLPRTANGTALAPGAKSGGAKSGDTEPPDSSGPPGDIEPTGPPDAAGLPGEAGPPSAAGLPGEAGLPGGIVATPAEAAGIGGRLLLDGRPFQAHEVFEDAWKAAPVADRALWRGLAQIAVGLTHARRGNPRGAVTLLRRGADNLRGYSAEPAPYGIDVALVAVRADEVAGLIERDGLAALPPEALLLPLGPKLPATPRPRPGEHSLPNRSPAWKPGWWRWRRPMRHLPLPRW
ncbi:MAG TPA: DUF309 domain-containing protein [Trebonia sp.]|nr:DUF309 domain-containing protein [Trebonia sp.]